MRGKRGFLKVLEAFIAVILIAGVMAFFYVQRSSIYGVEEQARQLIRVSLQEISNNVELRNAVLNGGYSDSTDSAVIGNRTIINDTLKTIISNQYDFHFEICDLTEACGYAGQLDRDVFSDEVSVSVTLDSVGLNPKKIRLFLWRAD